MHLIRSLCRHRPLRVFTIVVAVTLFAGAACSDDKDSDGTLKDDSSTTTAQTALAPEAAAKVRTVGDGRLTACIDVSNAPFGIEESGKVDGIEAELVRGLAGRFALNGDFVSVAGEKEALSALDAGKCDVAAASVAVTDDTRKNHLFSDPYFVVYPSLLVRSGDAAKFKDLGALDGRTIGVQAGTTSAQYAEENGAGATIKKFGDAGDRGGVLAALEAGQIDAVVHDLPVNAHHALSTQKTSVTKIFTNADKKLYGLAMPKDRTDLKELLDNALAQIKSDDTYPTPLRRFLGDFAAQVLKDIGAP